MSIFIQNKYTKWYYNIINNAISKSRKKSNNHYYENHHIIPKCMDGTNQKSNLVLLTAREHFMCHHLLTKMVIKRQVKYKLSIALHCMMRKSENQERFILTSRMYQLIKINISKEIKHHYKTNHPRMGIEITNSQKLQISKTLKEYYKNHTNPFAGKTHSDKTKEIISNNAKLGWKNKVYSPTYKIITPTNDEIIVGCLKHWAKDNNFSIETLKDSYYQNRILKRGPLKGYQVFKI